MEFAGSECPGFLIVLKGASTISSCLFLSQVISNSKQTTTDDSLRSPHYQRVKAKIHVLSIL